LNKLLASLAVLLPLVITLTTIPVFAENPTPYNEWDFDFDFSEVEIYQDPNDLQNMIIKTRVSFEGDMSLGTVNIYAHIIGPNGNEYTSFGTLRDMQSGDTGLVRLVHGIVQEGIYTIDLRMTPPSKPFLDHIFDTQTITYVVEKYGFEKEVETIGDDSDEMITYHIENPITVQYFESVHAVINLPEVHTFEQIKVTNGEFEKNFSINTKDIYMESKSGYKDLKVHLLKENNIFPMVDAQDTLQDYVQFYKVNKELCPTVNCVNINQEKPEEKFPLWVLVIVPVGISVGLIVYLKNNSKQKQSRLKSFSNIAKSFEVKSLDIGIPGFVNARIEKKEKQ